MSYKLQCGQGMEGVANHPFLAREITYCRPAHVQHRASPWAIKQGNSWTY